MYGFRTYYPKIENLVKVAATSVDGFVSVPARMPHAAFRAMVDAKWIERDAERRFRITTAGEGKLAAYKPADVFADAHGAKALETFRLMGTEPGDWFHPAVKWVPEIRPFIGMVKCPDCFHSSMRGYEAFYTAADSAKPDNDTTVRAVKPPTGARQYDSKFMVDKGCYDATFGDTLRDRWAAGVGGLVRQPCRHCRRPASNKRSSYRAHARPTGEVTGIVMREVMVGYILWPKGVSFRSRFGYGAVVSGSQCQVCGKGISKSYRVPVAHDKNGKALGMWVGSDCAKRFLRIAKIATPTKTENAKGLESVLDENYVVPGK